MRVMAWS